MTVFALLKPFPSSRNALLNTSSIFITADHSYQLLPINGRAAITTRLVGRRSANYDRLDIRRVAALQVVEDLLALPHFVLLGPDVIMLLDDVGSDVASIANDINRHAGSEQLGNVTPPNCMRTGT